MARGYGYVLSVPIMFLMVDPSVKALGTVIVANNPSLEIQGTSFTLLMVHWLKLPMGHECS